MSSLAHGIDAIVSRQVRRWESGRKAEGERERGPRLGPRPPCIAFSRLKHSGGEEIARRVAERLDWGFFGRSPAGQRYRSRPQNGDGIR